MTYRIDSTSSAATEQLGEQIGRSLRGGEVIELISDLGGGKTTLVRGMARGAGSTDAAASPSFTILREYAAGKLTIHHYDFYRLPEAGLMTQEISEALSDPQNVVVVEWGQAVTDVLPAERVTISITASDENKRQIEINLPNKYAYLRGEK